MGIEIKSDLGLVTFAHAANQIEEQTAVGHALLHPAGPTADVRYVKCSWAHFNGVAGTEVLRACDRSRQDILHRARVDGKNNR